jgi:hypothetical protein
MIEKEENPAEPESRPESESESDQAPDGSPTEAEIVELDHYFKKVLGGREDESER